ncbi:Gfo/Idh/MocA family protein [Chryseolinea lacunae]|uniref:Gfo/Idh/MocA family oxidoreductase n=1 Tax=Chryseolinea lacunae TaxID=2801331 RepID=A0ABS1KTI8_9BACT|nr:Gfo/Idh/MocA family oxidoreductase [Chryseolinea lacunae]MBL0742780.1 Gfo/Idh/MocA family oxidoreductase [Chryseolinea lacunae]
MQRRQFIQTTAAATVGLATAPLIKVLGKDKKYSTALIGSGWWGGNILRCAMQSGQCKIVGLCDVDTTQLNTTLDEVKKLTGDTPKLYRDFRELLAKEKPEIVIVATPDHWHPLIAIAAMQAGAHVYVEKPVCHTINEGKAMVKAARDTQRIVQVGTHRRVSPHNVSGMEFLKSGKAGKIGSVRAFVHYPGGPGAKTPDSEAPSTLDWNMWCGPAPLRPYNKTMHPKGFRSYLDYANGTLGDWGIHWMDQILWWTEEKHPKKVYSTGGRFIRQDNTDAPDTQNVIFQFESFTASWEHRQYAGNEAEKTNIGCYFYGTEGTFHMGWLDGWTFYPSDTKKQIIHQDPKLDMPDQQNIAALWTDFMNAIKTNKLPVCDIEIGQRSTNMSLLGMLSLKLGRGVDWDGEKGVIRNDAEANALLSRAYRGEWKYPQL